jgi:hypothetical protein
LVAARHAADVGQGNSGRPPRARATRRESHVAHDALIDTHRLRVLSRASIASQFAKSCTWRIINIGHDHCDGRCESPRAARGRTGAHDTWATRGGSCRAADKRTPNIEACLKPVQRLRPRRDTRWQREHAELLHGLDRHVVQHRRHPVEAAQRREVLQRLQDVVDRLRRGPERGALRRQQGLLLELRQQGLRLAQLRFYDGIPTDLAGTCTAVPPSG